MILCLRHYLLHSHSSSAPFSSLPYLPFPANLSLPHVPSFFNCSIHSSTDHRLLRPVADSSALCFLHYRSPTSGLGLMAGLLVNRHKQIPMMGQYRSSDDHVSYGIRVGPRPVATKIAMQCGGQEQDDAVLEEAMVALMSQDNRGCTMALGMTVLTPCSLRRPSLHLGLLGRRIFTYLCSLTPLEKEKFMMVGFAVVVLEL